jgi:hypothetical protein
LGRFEGLTHEENKMNKQHSKAIANRYREEYHTRYIRGRGRFWGKINRFFEPFWNAEDKIRFITTLGGSGIFIASLTAVLGLPIAAQFALSFGFIGGVIILSSAAHAEIKEWLRLKPRMNANFPFCHPRPARGSGRPSGRLVIY